MTKERFQELLKPIADGLFGKQRTRYGEMPHYTVRPVGMIVEDLCRIPEDEWAKYAFSREPLNGKFNDEQRLDLTRQAIACGREHAEKLAKQYGMRDPEKRSVSCSRSSVSRTTSTSIWTASAKAALC